MTQPEKVVRKSYAWFREAVEHALNQAVVPAAQKDQAVGLLSKLVGLNAGGPLPDNPALEDFASTDAVVESIVYAGLIIAESISAVDTVGRTVEFLQHDPQNNLGDALQLVGDVIKQVQRVIDNVPPKTLPSAFGLAKILLTLSGDANVPPQDGTPHAKKLAEALVGAGEPTGIRAAINKAFNSGAPVGDTDFKVEFSFGGGADCISGLVIGEPLNVLHHPQAPVSIGEGRKCALSTCCLST